MHFRATVKGMTREEWEPTRSAYERGPETVLAIAERLQVSPPTIRRAAIKFGWRLRAPRRIDRNDIVERLFRLLDSQIKTLEQDMSKAGQGEVAVLGRLVSTLDKLLSIKDANKPISRGKRSTREISDIKAKLIERIENLKRS